MRTVVVAGVALAVALLGAFILFAARGLERSVFRVWPRDDPLDLEVEGVREGAIGLRPRSHAGRAAVRRPGEHGLEFDGGYAEVGPVVETQHAEWGTVWRELRAVRGRLEAGTRARMDSFCFEHPEARALVVEEVNVESSSGTHPAWLVAGERERWVIFVHGKGARREEALRVMPVVRERGWTCLAISYRNDAGGPGRGHYAFGTEEWEDLEAAVALARERGATNVVLFGYSMGGGISLSFMRRSPLAGLVRGLVLDSPMSDLQTLLDLRMRQRRVPVLLTRAAVVLASRRARVRVGEARHGGHALDVPSLVFHGEADDVIPVELSERFARGREDVTLSRVPGAGHVLSWNVDRERYERAVAEFLAGLTLGPSPRARGEGSDDRG
jgi:pimeloyl-ACP methyl ester carboxylesterase